MKTRAEKNKFDLAASIEFTIVDILMKKLRMAVKQTGIKHAAANCVLRFADLGEEYEKIARAALKGIFEL